MDFDSIDERTAFKLGFLSYCADQGMDKAAAETFVKSSLAPVLAGAWPWITGGIAAAGGGAYLLNNAMRGTGEALKLDALIPIAGAMAGGAGLGWGAAKLNEPDITPDEIKAKEISDTYKRYTDRLKARQAYQQYRAARQMT